MAAKPQSAPAAVAPLVDSQDQLRTLLENVAAMVLTVSLDGYIQFANCSQFGFTADDLRGHSIFDFPAPDEQRALVRAAFDRAVQSGTAVDFETCTESPTGQTAWFACRIGPLVRDGRIAALTLIAIDITERRQVQQTLEESEQRFRRIAEQSPDIIFRLGRGGLEYISPAFQTILGVAPDERSADPHMVPQHIHPDDVDKLAAILPQLDRGPVRFELRMLHRDGHTVWTEHHLLPILSRAGKRVAVEGIVRDVSERKRAEAALHEAHRALEQRVAERTAELAQTNAALRAEIVERQRAQEQLRQHQAALAHVLRVSTMGEMAAGLAHEINQPLGAIANFANGIVARLRGGHGRPEALLGAAEQIAAEALRAGEVIRRLRDFLRRTEAQRAPCDVNALVRDAAHLVEPDARRAKIALCLGLAPTLPAVALDRIQVEQVLFNLMRNGLEAMTAGGELRVETLAVAGGLEVRVRDTGAGFPPDAVERIFDAFYTTKASGLGMGLSISRSIVEDHGGRLWAAPNADRGSTFGFTLPLVASPG